MLKHVLGAAILVVELTLAAYALQVSGAIYLARTTVQERELDGCLQIRIKRGISLDYHLVPLWGALIMSSPHSHYVEITGCGVNKRISIDDAGDLGLEDLWIGKKDNITCLLSGTCGGVARMTNEQRRRSFL